MVKKRLSEYCWKRYGSTVHIYDPIFTVNFYAATKIKHSTFQRNMKRDWGLNVPDPGRACGKFWVLEHGESDQEVGLIWADNDHAHLLHECFHATHWLLSSRGLSLCDESEEIYAYHQTFLFRCARGEL